MSRTLDCPCCKDYAAEADDAGQFDDGAPLACSCIGSVRVDELGARVVVSKDCDCDGGQ